jgi:hypothetical protein
MTPYLTASFLDWHEMKTVSKTAECHQPHVLWSGSTAMYRCRLPAPGDASAATWTMIHGSASFENDGCLAGASRMARADFLAPESTNHPRLRRLSVDGNSPNLTGCQRWEDPAGTDAWLGGSAYTYVPWKGFRVLAQDTLSRNMLRSFSSNTEAAGGARA